MKNAPAARKLLGMEGCSKMLLERVLALWGTDSEYERCSWKGTGTGYDRCLWTVYWHRVQKVLLGRVPGTRKECHEQPPQTAHTAMCNWTYLWHDEYMPVIAPENLTHADSTMHAHMLTAWSPCHTYTLNTQVSLRQIAAPDPLEALMAGHVNCVEFVGDQVGIPGGRPGQVRGFCWGMGGLCNTGTGEWLELVPLRSRLPCG